MTDPDAEERFLVLDPAGNVTAHTGNLDGVGALLGDSIVSCEATGGLCFASSGTHSATRHSDPKLHLSRMARALCQVSEPFYGTVVIFGGVPGPRRQPVRVGSAARRAGAGRDGFDPLHQSIFRRPSHRDRPGDPHR